MSWKIIYCESFRGERYVREFIDKQNAVIKAKYIGLLNLICEHGPLLGGKYTKKLTKNLYELRITGKDQIRILYSAESDRIYLLHAFKKKKQKTPLKEVKTALNRLDRI